MFTSRGHPRGQSAQASTPALQPSTLQSSTPARQPRQRVLRGASCDKLKQFVADMKAVLEEATRAAFDLAVRPTRSMLVGLFCGALVANGERVYILRERAQTVAESLSNIHQRHRQQPLPPHIMSRAEEIFQTSGVIACRAQRIAHRRGIITRYFTRKRDADLLETLKEEMNTVIQSAQDVERYMDMAMIQSSLDASVMLPYAKTAHFDSNQMRCPCLKGTRVEFLTQVCTWLTASRTAIPGDKIILWINGLAGTGKTAVAVSAAQWCQEQGILGGSFFFSRLDAECSDPNLVFVTLCRQLCHRDPSFKKNVEVALQHNRDIVNCDPFRQFEELIVGPLERKDSPPQLLVFVFDALDECKDKGTKSTILSVIARFAPRIAKFLRLIITSRLEQRITSLFETPREGSLKCATISLSLHDIPLNLALEDVKLYLGHEFADCIGLMGIKEGSCWPSPDETNKLVGLSHGSFGYAAAAIKFIMNATRGNPMRQLRLLLAAYPDASTPHEFLSSLYSEMILPSYDQASPEHIYKLRDVLSTVARAQEPLSPYAVASLVGIDVASVMGAQVGLHAVLNIPIDDHQPIRIIHPTLVEFLLQSPECGLTQLGCISTPLDVQPATQHWSLFSRCINTMCAELKRDIIGIRYPAMFQREVLDLKNKVNKAVEPHVSYACRLWSYHLRYGVGRAVASDSALFGGFVCRSLYWLEICVLLNVLERVPSILDEAQDACQMLGGKFEDLIPLLADCRRFALTYAPCINAAPLQIYHSALSFAPLDSRIRTTFSQELKYPSIACRRPPSCWPSCIDTIDGHTGSTARAVAFSSDGSFFATAGGKNVTIRQTVTRSVVSSFDGHTDWVRCLTISPDGLHAASGSDNMVYVWQTSSGALVDTLKGHTGNIVCVAYTADGRSILSATSRGETKLWDATDRHCLLTLDETRNYTWQISISPDGSVIARGDGASLRLHDVSSSASETLGFPDKVEACTFSPDGRHLAARSTHSIRVWGYVGKTLVRSSESDINIPGTLSTRLLFSPDGAYIGCGAQDGSIRIWRLKSEDSPRILQIHSEGVWDFAWSPGRSQVVAVATASRAQLWVLTQSSAPADEQNIDGNVRPLSPPESPRFALMQSGDNPIALPYLPALATDAQHFPIRARMPEGAPTATLFTDIVSAWDSALQAADDSVISDREWALLTGQQYSQLSWRPIAISPDSSLIAYLSPTNDKWVDVCDLHTGKMVASLTGHTEGVRSIAFFPDNTHLATGSQGRSVQVWHLPTGDRVCGHIEHQKGVLAVACSYDGSLVASGSEDNTVRIFELATERVIRVLDTPRTLVMHATFATDNAHLVALDSAHWVHVWDIEAGAHIREFLITDDSSVDSFVFIPGGTSVLLDNGSASRTVTLQNPGTRTWPVHHVTRDGWVYAMSPGSTRRIGWLPSGWRVVLGSDDGRLCVREASRSKLYGKGRAVVLDVSDCLEYVVSLDAR